MSVKCPLCGREIERGRLYGKAPLLWSPKEKKCTLLRGREDVSLFNGAFPEAWICKDCHKVVVHYK